MQRMSCFLLLIFLCYGTVQNVRGFYYRPVQFVEMERLSRAKPLSTTGINSAKHPICDAIPRLEPGRRFFFQKQMVSANYPVKTKMFSLDCLKGIDRKLESEPAINGDSTKKRGIFSSIRKASNLFRLVPLQMVKWLGHVCTSGKQLYEQISALVMNWVKQIVTVSMVVAGSLTSLPNMGLGGNAAALLRKSSIVAAVTATTTFLPATGGRSIAQASALKKYANLSPTQRLASTPLYYVSNSRGNSYLQEDIQAGRPQQRIVTYFMSSEDASDYLNEMAQVNSYSANEFRIMTVSMEKIVNQIQSKKQSRKLGRYDVDMVYRIQPSARQCANAEAVVSTGGNTGKSAATIQNKKKAQQQKKMQKQAQQSSNRRKQQQQQQQVTQQTNSYLSASKQLQGLSIPMFSARGMAVRRPNGEVITPYYFALEDLVDDWRGVKDGMSADPKVVVSDFTDVMCLAQGIHSQSIDYQPTSSSSSSSATGSSASSKGGKGTQKQKNNKANNAAAATTTTTSQLTPEEVEKAILTPGIMPPRREIEMIRKYYRNQAGLRNEFSKAKYLG